MTSEDQAGWTVTYAHDGSRFGGVDGKPLRVSVGGAPARFVRIDFAGTNFPHLDWVEIYAAHTPA